jgi:2-dehydropantoate 2-reductase
MGAICEEPALRERAMAIMKEIGQIAAKRGIDLPEDITALTFQKAAAFPYHTPTSLQLDIRSKKASNELDLFAGAIVRYGGELGIPVPETEKIYREIKEIINNYA